MDKSRYNVLTKGKTGHEFYEFSRIGIMIRENS
jgi:hypothetical protein